MHFLAFALFSSASVLSAPSPQVPANSDQAPAAIIPAPQPKAETFPHYDSVMGHTMEIGTPDLEHMVYAQSVQECLTKCSRSIRCYGVNVKHETKECFLKGKNTHGVLAKPAPGFDWHRKLHAFDVSWDSNGLFREGLGWSYVNGPAPWRSLYRFKCKFPSFETEWSDPYLIEKEFLQAPVIRAGPITGDPHACVIDGQIGSLEIQRKGQGYLDFTTINGHAHLLERDTQQAYQNVASYFVDRVNTWIPPPPSGCQPNKDPCGCAWQNAGMWAPINCYPWTA